MSTDLKWKLYYSDGSTFSDADGSWASAPGLGVQALVVEDDDTGWTVEEGSGGFVANYVWWSDADRPWGIDHYGTLDYLVDIGVLEMGEPITTLALGQLLTAGVKVGRSIDTPEFHKIMQRARRDAYFPTKSARQKRERPEG